MVQERSLRIVAPGSWMKAASACAPYFIPGLYRVINGGAKATGKANSMNSGVRSSAWRSRSELALIGAGLVQLLVFLGEIVRVGDAAVDERRRSGNAPAFARPRRRSGPARPGTSILPGSRQRAARAAATFRPRREAWQGRRRSPGRSARSSRRSAPGAGRRCIHARAPSNNGSSAARSRGRARDPHRP